jgi:DNA topoisomerase IB
MRLRRVSTKEPGWTRRRAGKGFVYVDAEGNRVDGTDVERIKALVIPPAWKDVWICTVENGHLQCVGTDDAGRRQYLYHPDWRKKQDEAKFARVVQMAKRLPTVRARVTEDLGDSQPTRDRVLAASVRLLDVGYFRVGNDFYADEHGSYGLTTLLRSHVRRQGDGHLFRFQGKSGIEHEIEVNEPAVNAVVEQLRRRRGGGDELLAYKDGPRWRDVTAADVNDYLREVFRGEFTAKDFRTWHATVIAAAVLADDESLQATTVAARKRAVTRAAKEVAEYLGNTPTIARGSYIDPRVVDQYEDGVTIAAALKRAPKDPAKRQVRLERAVVRMLSP